MPYGRPLKGKTRRIPLTVHAPLGTLDIIDEYVAERAQIEIGAYSRSDFYEEAAMAYLKQLGRVAEDEERRTEIVLSDSTTRGTTNNVSGKGAENG